MAESVIKRLTIGERAWIRRYARAGMPMADLAEYASAKADANISPAEVERFLNDIDGPTNGACPYSVAIISGGLIEVLKRLNPAGKAWIRIGHSRGKSPAAIAAGLTAKHGIRVDTEEVAVYVARPASIDEVMPSEEIRTIEDIARRIASDIDSDLDFLSETETSDRYIKPFFKLLGWDFQDHAQVKQNRFNGKGVKGQSQFDIHLNYTDEVMSIIVESKRFVTDICDASGGLRPMHQSQFERYRREPHRILAFTNGRELIAFAVDKKDPVLVIKHTDWARSFDEAKRLMSP